MVSLNLWQPNCFQKNKAISPATFGVVQSTNNKEDYDICNCRGTDDDPCGPTSNCINRDMQYECHPKFCPAEGFCRNQRLRRKQYPSLKTYYTADRGWALKAMEDIPEVKSGFFVQLLCVPVNKFGESAEPNGRSSDTGQSFIFRLSRLNPGFLILPARVYKRRFYAAFLGSIVVNANSSP